MAQQFTYIANWKMQKSFHDAVDFCITHKTQLQELAQEAALILCPTFPALFPTAQHMHDTGVYIGAQNCSQHQHGAFTGQVDALSLFQAGCTYCLVGHSEQRNLFGESNEVVADKMLRVLENNMTPIICIGETQEQFHHKETYHILEAQLESALQKLIAYQNSTFLIAYEPIWSIGTGIVPQIDYLNNLFSWLNQHIKTYAPTNPILLLYGGSVTDMNIRDLKQIPYVDGFLIGGASLDFKKLQNIVKYTY
ncbi:MAG TPA: triose-phosphate isomerase [Candidatus Dependentiae bacterium]|nr:triose-phosphate isomerase [Candidatus Dependentiae bacterium]HRQ63000.1 triose-phosphate isomerase [Candidatus Dependentiae bacterium]